MKIVIILILLALSLIAVEDPKVSSPRSPEENNQK